MAPAASGETTDRPQRADARRNRTRILDAAARAFADHGSAVSIGQIAAEAGVGVGTIYRHFANRNALLEAVVIARLDELEQTARDSPGTPADVLFATIAALGNSSVTDVGIVAAMHDAKLGGDAFVAVEAALERLIDDVLGAAQASGEIDPAVTSTTIKALLVGQQTAAATGGDEAARHHLAVIERGLRVGA